MKYDFPEVMRAHSDAELLEIVTQERDNYQPDALSAAEAELARRNLAAPRLEKAKKQIERKAVARRKRGKERLGVGWKVLLVLFPGVLALLIARALKAEGYDRKHREVWRFTLYGVALYSLVTVPVVISKLIVLMAR